MEPLLRDHAPAPGPTHQKVRVIVVDDHALVADSLRRVFDDEPDLVVVGTAGSASEALHDLREVDADVIVLDRRLPDGDGISLGASLRTERPGTALLLLTGDPATQYVQAALDAGFSGVLEKTCNVDRLVHAVHDAAAGRATVSLADIARLRRADLPGGAEDLTARECEILRYMAQALPYKDIAARAYLSVNTVRKHVQSILRKLGAHSKLEGVLIARERGLVEIP